MPITCVYKNNLFKFIGCVKRRGGARPLCCGSIQICHTLLGLSSKMAQDDSERRVSSYETATVSSLPYIPLVSPIYIS